MQVARAKLSRRPTDVILTYSDESSFIACFNNGAFQDNRALYEDGVNIAWVSGDPLITNEDGVSNNPAASVAEVYNAIANDATAGLSRAAGSFVAASWNRRDRTWRFCSDKLALRPLYVYLDSSECVFATNLRTLRELVGRSLEIDEQGFAEMIYFGQSLGSRTVYKNVRVLQPGEIWTIGLKEERSRRYFDWNAIARYDGDESATCAALYDRFIRAIRRRSRRKTEDAFLSGGLDSRCVVAGLLDIGRNVRTFGFCYPNSADDIISRLVAKSFGTFHTAHHSDPVERLKRTVDNFAVQARKYFPTEPTDQKDVGRIIWSGDGGSVGIGHVYLKERTIGLAAGNLSDAALHELFADFDKGGTRLISASKCSRLRRLAFAGMRGELEAITPQRPDRRLFLFYLLNDQMRHLYDHFEDIDISGIEFATPFFDADFLSIIVASSANMYLRHGLYNRWLTNFKTCAASLPWQVYPGHIAGPHPMPDGIASQWSGNWYSGPQIRRAADQIAASILHTSDIRLWRYVRRSTMLVLRALNRLGVERYNYELWLARRIFQAITGEPGSGC